MLDGPWAKLERDGEKRAVAALPLLDHCLDVGVAFAAMVPVWRALLEAAAGRALSDQDVARLIVLVALHDLGKANRGFQARIDPKVKEPVGHTGPVAALLRHSQLRVSAAGSTLRAMIADWGAVALFAAVMAHHGKPLAEFHERSTVQTGSWTKHVGHWMPKQDDPTRHVTGLIDAMRVRWPLAFEAGPPLPDAPRFVALFAGLVTLADWIGSDTRRFPIAAPHGAAREAWRAQQAGEAVVARGLTPLATPAGDFVDALVHPPRRFQSEAAAVDLGAVALIEAETGSGKTEAALWRWLELRRRGEVDGLFFALPTRSAAVQLHGRVGDMLTRVWGDAAPEAVLAVPGYLRAGDAVGQALPDHAVRWDEPGGAEDARWAAERSNRFLAARVAVGTIDQALLAALPVRHALFRAGMLSRSLLVVDEVHASDTYMTGLLERLLDQHVAVGGRALLLSATLGSAARARLLKQPVLTPEDAQAVPYPALSGTSAVPRAAPGADGAGKAVRVAVAGWVDDAEAIAAHAIEAARGGAAVLVVRNTVGGAVAVAQAVAAQAPDLAFTAGNVATLHHGRFARADRERLDRRVEEVLGRGRAAGGCVVVGTQTLEQSLDIDADYLITDLAPVDVLLQRIGRLHRHARQDRGAFADARVMVLRPAGRDRTPLLEGARPQGLGSVYEDVVALEATLRLLEATPDIVIPRDNRRLVEGATHPDALRAVAAAGGVAWGNHLAQRAGGEEAKGRSAALIALDLSRRFTELEFPPDLTDVVTRLGARDLLIDLPEPLASPFGGSVTRIAIPGHWAKGISPADEAVCVDAQRFRVGARAFRYDQWGLTRD